MSSAESTRLLNTISPVTSPRLIAQQTLQSLKKQAHVTSALPPATMIASGGATNLSSSAKMLRQGGKGGGSVTSVSLSCTDAEDEGSGSLSRKFPKRIFVPEEKEPEKEGRGKRKRTHGKHNPTRMKQTRADGDEVCEKNIDDSPQPQNQDQKKKRMDSDLHHQNNKTKPTAPPLKREDEKPAVIFHLQDDRNRQALYLRDLMQLALWGLPLPHGPIVENPKWVFIQNKRFVKHVLLVLVHGVAHDDVVYTPSSSSAVHQHGNANAKKKSPHLVPLDHPPPHKKDSFAAECSEEEQRNLSKLILQPIREEQFNKHHPVAKQRQWWRQHAESSLGGALPPRPSSFAALSAKHRLVQVAGLSVSHHTGFCEAAMFFKYERGGGRDAIVKKHGGAAPVLDHRCLVEGGPSLVTPTLEEDPPITSSSSGKRKKPAGAAALKEFLLNKSKGRNSSGGEASTSREEDGGKSPKPQDVPRTLLQWSGEEQSLWDAAFIPLCDEHAEKEEQNMHCSFSKTATPSLGPHSTTSVLKDYIMSYQDELDHHGYITHKESTLIHNPLPLPLFRSFSPYSQRRYDQETRRDVDEPRGGTFLHSLGAKVSQSHHHHQHLLFTQEKAVAMDCEMVLTDAGHQLARLTILRVPNAEVVLDTLVLPRDPVVNYLTCYSGVDEEMLAECKTTFLMAQDYIHQIISTQTLVIGHSLENDFKAIEFYPNCRIIDTSFLYPHPNGLPAKNSLKFLVSHYLGGRIIQGNSKTGHDSFEDAAVCIELLFLKLKYGKEFGCSFKKNILLDLALEPPALSSGDKASADHPRQEDPPHEEKRRKPIISDDVALLESPGTKPPPTASRSGISFPSSHDGCVEPHVVVHLVDRPDSLRRVVPNLSLHSSGVMLHTCACFQDRDVCRKLTHLFKAHEQKYNSSGNNAVDDSKITEDETVPPCSFSFAQLHNLGLSERAHQQQQDVVGEEEGEQEKEKSEKCRLHNLLKFVSRAMHCKNEEGKEVADNEDEDAKHLLSRAELLDASISLLAALEKQKQDLDKEKKCEKKKLSHRKTTTELGEEGIIGQKRKRNEAFSDTHDNHSATKVVIAAEEASSPTGKIATLAETLKQYHTGEVKRGTDLLADNDNDEDEDEDKTFEKESSPEILSESMKKFLLPEVKVLQLNLEINGILNAAPDQCLCVVACTGKNSSSSSVKSSASPQGIVFSWVKDSEGYVHLPTTFQDLFYEREHNGSSASSSNINSPGQAQNCAQQ